MSRTPPSIWVVGAMSGGIRGRIVTQGEQVGRRLRAAGHAVTFLSARRGRGARLAEVLFGLGRHGRDHDVLLLDVYSGLSFVVADVASALGRRKRLRILMTLHGGGLAEFLSRWPWWARRALGRADALIAPSPFLARVAVRLGLDCEVVPNGIDLEQYPHRTRRALEPRLFWLRAFHPIYNPAMALRVLARLRAPYPAATLVMAGADKGLERDTRRLAERMGLADRVRFPGFLDARRKREAADTADVFLNTSRVDNAPVTVLEACAFGLPVVSTAVGGVPDLLTPEITGLLVPDDDDGRMAGAVRSLLDDVDRAERLSIEGRGLAERSAWSRVDAVWARLVSGPELSPPPRRASMLPARGNESTVGAGNLR